ncbi:MAG: hypothetical protein JNJ44_06360 [Zoogloeaceae bacterium]|nr:hypothetical protein [Zoogloeaceae bacterium]
MKRLLLAAMVVVAGVSGQASANCTDNRVAQNNLRSLLAGNTVCGERGSGASLERWQEEHLGTGNGASALWDFKLGAGHPVDPRKQVGTWEASNGAGATVSYIYTGSATTYSYAVYRVGTTDRYSFCNSPGGTEVVQVRVQTGTGAGCTSY